ncbi:MAG TPA: S41 family peptidase [Lachnospiraceae bacterium]|nr:S41 family peptidase [Lachnospiraceae bacterium]
MDNQNIQINNGAPMGYVPPKAPSRVPAFLGGLFTGILVVGLVAAIVLNYYSPAGQANPSAKSDKADDGKQSSKTGTVLDQETINKLARLENYIDEYYLGDYTEEDLKDSLYHGLFKGLNDPYSVYYSPEEMEAFEATESGVYYGIGAYIGYDEETRYCKIVKPMPGSPAEEAGLMPDDIIVEVNGEEMFEVPSAEIVTYIKGPEHTTVDLTIFREGETDYLHFTVERRSIETPTVELAMDDDGIAHIQIAEFNELSAEQFEDKLSEAKKNGMKGLILDLRDNPGGSVQQVVDIANHILPKGIIVYTEDKNGKRKEYRSDGRDELQVPMVVLVNGNSASASEILAGAIKDYEKGTILGTTTFGKGIVQRVFPLSDNSAFKLTISHYYTPKGNDIHKVGVAPDEELEFDVDAYKEDGTDNQLERAKEILKNKQ